jgi:hypothetical protein
MITALVIWLYKKYIGKALSNRHYKARAKSLRFLILLLLLPHLVFCEERTSSYAIKHNGNVIGQLIFSRTISGQDIFLKMNSHVKTRFIFGIDVKTSDQSHFSKGMLINSHVYRSVNGKEKENKKTCFVNNNYQTRSGSKTGKMDRPINYNMMMLYYDEPVKVSQVYSDNFQQFLSIKSLTRHSYRIELPDGNYNDYHFQNGICKLVEIHHSMYTIKMELI